MPPRATRASANAKEASAGAAAAAETPGSKRKRRSSQDSPLKVVLPSPSAIAKANNASISASPDKVIGDADHESKRQKLSLKIHVHGAEKPQEVKIEKEIEGALSKEIREGLSVVIARASLKMNRWKERRAQRGFGGFGSITRGVTSEPFMPSFGPSFDSHHATGGQGFYSTLEGMHERARHREWARRVLRRAKSIEEGGYRGSLEGSKGKEKATVDDVLTENGGLIEELQAWQEIRVRKGVSTVTEREHQVAEELLSSLTKLTGNISPADMLKASTSKVGLAHELARRFLPVSSASIRGTLDPRRPQALHDNITVKPRTMTAQIGGLSKPPSASPHVPPPMKSNVMPPPPMPQYHVPPPHTLPSGGRPNSSEHRTSSTPTRVAYPYTASPGAGNPVYNNRPSGTPSTASLTPTAPGTSSGLYPRSAVGPGPSNLRQSFAPGTPGANGIPYGMSGAGLGIGSGNVGMPSASR